MKKNITSLNKQIVKSLKAGDMVFLSGIIYTARDQAHSRLVELVKKGEKLPFDLNEKIIYYCGPTPAPAGKVIGSCGPTTSSRMDSFTKELLSKGVIAMIGKGGRAEYVRELIKKYKAVYFVAPSGCGALLTRRVLSKRLVCFKDLGAEAVYELAVKDFPLVVAIDSKGNNIYNV